MRKLSLLTKIFASFVTTILLTATTALPAAAADLPELRLQVSPTFAELPELEPGKTYDGTFKVQNTGTQDFNYETSIDPYSVQDEQYGIDSTTESNYTQITDWITIAPKSGTLAAGATEEVKYTIKVPQNAPGGGQYALINVTMLPPTDATDGTSIVTAKQIGFRVLADIEGNTQRAGSVVESKIDSIRFNPPITATSIVENTGNTHIRARYVLQVYPLFSNEEVYTNEEQPIELTILPNTRRFNSISWESAPHLGIFRVKQTVSIADDVNTLDKIVFLCPIWFLFIILLVIFIAVFWIVNRVRTRNK